MCENSLHPVLGYCGPPLTCFSDFPFQHNTRNPGMDINVTGIWERNVTGRGVTVVVVDDGVQHTIQDIQPNYVSSTITKGVACFHPLETDRAELWDVEVLAEKSAEQQPDCASLPPPYTIQITAPRCQSCF